jgi:hypothetical protein
MKYAGGQGPKREKDLPVWDESEVFPPDASVADVCVAATMVVFCTVIVETPPFGSVVLSARRTV